MSAQVVMGGRGGENRQIAAAVGISLLLHIAFFWFGQDLSLAGGERGASAPVYHTIEVALVAGRQQPQRTVAQRQPRSLGAVRIPDRQPSAPAVTQAADEPASTAEANEAADNAGGEGTEANALAASSGDVGAGLRDRYLAAVLAHIESHKFYPQPARRRGLQGLVDVRFTLDARGMISDLDVTGSNSLFVEAARAAVRNAIPLPAAPSLDGFPLSVRYQMVFKLQ